MERIKRLLCIVSVMNAGGAETFLMKLYRNLDRSKYQMDFCVNSREKGFYDDEIYLLGGRIYTVPCKSENLKVFADELGKIIRDNHYEYVLRITSNAMGFYDLKIAKKNGARKCIARSSNSSDGSGYKVKIAHFIGKILYERYVDVKIAPSDMAAEYTFGKKACNNGQVFFLHNAVDLTEYSFNLDSRIKIRKELAISDSTKVIGHVGRFSHQKNHEFLIKIFNEILKLNPDCKLILVGEGELKAMVEDSVNYYKIADNVIFTGVRDDIPKLMSAFDVFLFPSFYEGMPNTVIEAQAAGLPCVLSDTITKEADITGLLDYKDLSLSEKIWAKETLKMAQHSHIDTREKFEQAGYDIKIVAKEFEKIIFRDLKCIYEQSDEHIGK